MLLSYSLSLRTRTKHRDRFVVVWVTARGERRLLWEREWRRHPLTGDASGA